jgi:hypothetical protein
MIAVSALAYTLCGKKGASSVAEGILQFAVIFGFTCLCVWLMSKTALRKYVS